MLCVTNQLAYPENRLQLTPLNPVPANIKTYPAFEKFGIQLFAAPPTEVKGPVEILLAAKEKLILAVSLTKSEKSNTGNGLAAVRQTESGWTVFAGFPENSTYQLTLSGRPEAAAEKENAIILQLNLKVKLEISHWQFIPDFQRYGLLVMATPGRELEKNTEILLASQSPQGISLSYSISNKTTGKSAHEGVKIIQEANTWNITIAFPENGEYELSLYGQTQDEKKYAKVAQVRFNVNLKLSADESLANALRMQDLDNLKKALEKGANPNVLVKQFRDFFYNEKRYTEDAYPVFFVLRWYTTGLEKQIEALKLLKARGASFKTLTSSGDTLLAVFFNTLSKKTDASMRLFKVLLELGADPAQETAYSYYQNDKDVNTTISILLNLEKFGYKDADKFTDFIPLLIQHHANPDARWPWGETILGNLFSKYKDGSKVLIHAYLDAGLDPGADDLRSMVHAMNFASFDGDFDLVAKVFSKSTHINDRNKYGDAFLHSLVKDVKDKPALLKQCLALLVTKGADLYVSNDQCETPLMVAARVLNKNAVDELLARGVDPRRAGISGKNVFHALASSMSGEITTSNEITALHWLLASLKAKSHAPGMVYLRLLCIWQQSQAILRSSKPFLQKRCIGIQRIAMAGLQ